MSILLELCDLHVSFNGFHAINGVDLIVEEGEMRVIIGPNGAGKTTLLDLITGKSKPTEGDVVFQGKNITGLPASEIASKYKIGRKFQGPNIFENISVYDNIEVAVGGYTGVFDNLFFRRSKHLEERINDILKQILLYDKKDVPASSLSHGEKQWLEIGMVMAQSPKLIVLDEPTSGMTAYETYKTGEMMKSLLGLHTVIVIEHDMDFVKQVAEKVTVLHQGKVIADGFYDDVEKDPKVIEVYLKDCEE